MVQWDEAWAWLSVDAGRIKLRLSQKQGLKPWFDTSTDSTADLRQCWIVPVNQRLIVTTVNQIHGVSRGAPWVRWTADCPRTIGTPAAFSDKVVAVPTVKGVIFFDASTGKRSEIGIPYGQGSVSVACRKSRILILDHEKSRMACYQVE